MKRFEDFRKECRAVAESSSAYSQTEVQRVRERHKKEEVEMRKRHAREMQTARAKDARKKLQKQKSKDDARLLSAVKHAAR